MSISPCFHISTLCIPGTPAMSGAAPLSSIKWSSEYAAPPWIGPISNTFHISNRLTSIQDRNQCPFQCSLESDTKHRKGQPLGWPPPECAGPLSSPFSTQEWEGARGPAFPRPHWNTPWATYNLQSVIQSSLCCACWPGSQNFPSSLLGRGEAR